MRLNELKNTTVSLTPLLVIQHLSAEGPGRLQANWEATGRPAHVACPYAQDKLPTSLATYGGLIVLGGPMSVGDTERFPWLTTEILLIQEALSRELPVLGVCLGAQLLAQALGAQVYPGPEPEIGWYPLQLTPAGRQDRIFGRLPEKFMAFHWHGDTFDLPQGAIWLACSERYQHQAFCHNNAYGLQFHLEATGEMIERWAQANEREFRAAGARPSRLPVWNERYTPELDRQTQDVFSRLFGR